MENENLDTLLTALYVKLDDEIEGTRRMGRPPLLTGSGLVCLAVALPGYESGARWLRFARKHLSGMFPVPAATVRLQQRLRTASPLVKKAFRVLATDTDLWFDNHWIASSTPVPCEMPRPTVKRPDLAGWAGYGYCASHSRFFWACACTWCRSIATYSSEPLWPSRLTIVRLPESCDPL